jgi:hypothetical protein
VSAAQPAVHGGLGRRSLLRKLHSLRLRRGCILPRHLARRAVIRAAAKCKRGC